MSTWHARAKVATRGIKFQCQRCTRCCSGEVVLTYWDIEEISKKHPEYDALEVKDAIHVETARSRKADIIISTDSDLLAHTKKFDGIGIMDTDDALKYL